MRLTETSSTTREQNYKEVLDWLSGYVDDATWRKLDLAKGRKEVAAKRKSSIFAEVETITNVTGLEIPDDGRYKLLVLVSDSVVGDELDKGDQRAKQLVENIMFKIGEKQRTERNTVYILLPSTQDLFQCAVELSASRIACDKVTDEIENIYKGAAKEVIDVQRGMINTINEHRLRRLGEVVLGTYTSIT